MKKPLLYILLGSAAFVSCSKYLEKEPDNRAKLTSPEKVSQLLVSAYPSANYMAFSEAMSDNVGDKGSGATDVTNSAPYAFENVPNPFQDSPDYYWEACYNAIAAANNALEACTNAANPQDYRSQKGEALVARAYAHFMLVTFYAKPYDPATASANPGIPYVLEPETTVIKEYTRGTVASVYEKIENDLLEGIPLIDDASYAVPRYHFNRAAANAFAARFFLHKQNYERAVQYSNASIPDLLPSLRPWNTVYQTYGINNLPAVYQKTTEAANLLLVTVPSLYNYGYAYARYRYGLTPSIFNSIRDNPLGVTGGDWSYTSGFIGSQRNPAIPKLNGMDFARSNPSVDYGVSYGTINLFTAEEVLFNKAEANTYLGNYDLVITDLNTYLSTRLTGVNPGSLPAAQQVTQAKVRAHYNNSLPIRESLVLYILELKRLEFLQEGMRWFDILRYNMPVTHSFFDGSSLTIEAGDKLRQLKLPDGVKLSGITDLNR